MTKGCPKGSAFGPLIWNIFQNDLTYTLDANMNMGADDHQFYGVGSTLSDVHDELVVCAESASSWCRANLLQGNLDKYQTMALGCEKDPMDSIMIDNHEVRSTECLKLLGVCIDNNLCFDEHMSSISKKSAQRVDVLMRLRNLIPTKTKSQLYKAAVLPYLTYFHLIWHFCRASDSRRLERSQERALRGLFIVINIRPMVNNYLWPGYLLYTIGDYRT